MRALLIQPHLLRFEIGGFRGPTNRARVVIDILKSDFEIDIGTKIAKGDERFVDGEKRVKYKLLKDGQSVGKYDLLVMLNGTFNYCFPPSEPFDDKHRCIYAITHTDCPILFIQDEYITQNSGFPANVSKIARIKNKFDHETVSGRKIAVLMQAKHSRALARSISDAFNCYDSYEDYYFINWGVTPYAFRDREALSVSKDIEAKMRYIGVARPERRRLFELLDDERAEIYGRWPETQKARFENAQFKNKVKVEDVPSVLNKSTAAMWTIEDFLFGFSLETARLYEAVKCGVPLLIDTKPWRYQHDCIYNGIDCFFESKDSFWDKVEMLYNSNKLRAKIVKQQSEAVASFNLSAHSEKLLKIANKVAEM